MKESAKTKWILWGVIGLLLVGCIAWMLWPKAQGPRRMASVWIDGVTVMEFDLNTAEDRIISLEEYTKHPISLEVKEGAVRFLESDCPDKICVNTGFLREDGEIASCLPNKVIITIEVSNPESTGRLFDKFNFSASAEIKLEVEKQKH